MRLLRFILGLLTFAVLLTGLLSFTLQYRWMTDRANADLEQEVEELGQLAALGPGGTGATPYEDVFELFRSFLNSAVTGEDEALLALIDDGAIVRSGGERSFDPAHPEVIRAINAVDVPEGRAVKTTLRTQGTTLRLNIADVQLPGDARAAQFVVLIDVGAQQDELLRRIASYVGASLAVLLVGGLLGHVVLGRLLRPLSELQRATARISTEDLSDRVVVEDADTDIAQLGVRFNEMLDRIEAGVNQQRQFLDDAAHELRTPLTILRGNTELLRPEDPDEVRTTRVLLLKEIDRMQRLVDDLLLLARSQRPDFLRAAPVDVTELAVECMDRVTSLGDRRWRLSADAEGELLLDRQRIIQAVVQLAANAVKFSAPGTPIEIGCRWVAAGAPEAAAARQSGAGGPGVSRYLALSVSDQGSGIPAEGLARIFDRFVRADNATRVEGSGLGLAIVRAIAQAHHGEIHAESVEGVGSRFTLWLPDTGHPAAAPSN